MKTKDNPYWYRDPRLLRAAKEEYGSLQSAAEALGSPDKSTLQYWWRNLGLEKLPKGPAPSKPANSEELMKLYRKVYG